MTMTMKGSRVRCDRTPAWTQLQRRFDQHGKNFDLRTAFAADSQRFSIFSQQAPHVFADLSKNLIDVGVQDVLLELARQCGLEQHRDAMFAGEPINRTENRAVMHFLLRKPAQAPEERAQAATKSIADELRKVEDTRRAMLAYAEQVRADAAITDVVNIGIGGSDLGPQMVTLALAEFAALPKRVHFVSNVDGQELAGVLAHCKPQSTLFLIASKTFTTTETMTNAHSAKAWFEAQGGLEIGRHFAALTTNVAAANAFGIQTTFGFWDWVGGRFSLWSAIGLPVAIAIGAAGFRELLAGAHAMDEHFRTAPLAQNLPVRLGLLDVWYRNFHGFTSRSIAPYSSPLRRLPAYLQQLEMESNGKRVDASGEALPFDTSPVLWGEPGTNAQHAYFQLLHQGSSVVPVEFVAVKKAAMSLPGHHTQLLANALAQAQALMIGKRDAAGPPQGDAAPAGGSWLLGSDINFAAMQNIASVGQAEGLANLGSDPKNQRGGSDLAGGHKNFPGNRPSTFFLLDELTPASLGALIALHEHRVFVSGSLWGINSFDQWGVELGKVLAKDMQARLETGDAAGLDGSSAGLLHRIHKK